MSTLIERSASPSPAPAAAPGDGGLRFVPVRVNLLPDEIVAGRRTEVLRRQVLMGLGALVVVLVLIFGFSWWQTHSANGDLDSARAAQTSLQKESMRYAPLVADKATTAAIQSELRQLMAGDVTWNSMLRTLRRAAPRGISISQVDGIVTAGAASGSSGAGGSGSSGNGAAPDVLNQTGLAQIGTITLTGTAPSKNSVADFADALSGIRGLGPAFVSNVATTDGRTSWTVSAPLTTAALGGRYHGGK